MASARPAFPVRSYRREQITLRGYFVTTTSGTISTTTGNSPTMKTAGFTVAKTATEAGRYTVTFGEKWAALFGWNARLSGATDADYTTAKGLNPLLRNLALSSKTLDIQFTRSDTSADAEILDGATVWLEFTVSMVA